MERHALHLSPRILYSHDVNAICIYTKMTISYKYIHTPYLYVLYLYDDYNITHYDMDIDVDDRSASLYHQKSCLRIPQRSCKY